MKTNFWVFGASLWGLLAALPACALLGNSPPIVPRYFAPDIDGPVSESARAEPPRAESRPPDSAPARGEAQAMGDRRLRLGRIQAAAHLRERMAYRTSEDEVAYYDDRRWTERPESYLRRSLSRSLFEIRGITRVVSGAAPTLEAELVSFEEIKAGDHRVKVEVVISLDDASAGSVQRSITVMRKVDGEDGEDPAPVVKALAQALSEAVERIGDQVIERLDHLAPRQPPATPEASE